MQSKFTELLDKIDPNKIHIPVEKELNEILAGYRIEKNVLQNYDECDLYLDDFFKEIMKKQLNLSDSFFEEEDRIPRENFLKYLKRRYTIIEMYSIMMNGTQGGVYQIFKTLINEMIHYSSNFHVRETVIEYLRDKEFDDLLKDAKEYISKYDYLVSKEYKEDPILIIPKFQEILIKHGWALKRVRELNQTA